MLRRERSGGKCLVCGEPIKQPARGRKRRTCSERCRKRLWRWQNPRCPVCGERFKVSMAGQVYCSEVCRRRSIFLRDLYARRMRAAQEMAGYRPEWLPPAGSAERAGAVPDVGEGRPAWMGAYDPPDESELRKRAEALAAAQEAAEAQRARDRELYGYGNAERPAAEPEEDEENEEAEAAWREEAAKWREAAKEAEAHQRRARYWRRLLEDEW